MNRAASAFNRRQFSQIETALRGLLPYSPKFLTKRALERAADGQWPT
jgi:hypothetical protein